MDVLTRLLYELEGFGLPDIMEEKEAVSIASVVLQAGTTYRATFTAALTETVYTSDYLFIESGSNDGFYAITAVGADYVDFTSTYARTNEQSAAIIYKVKTNRLNTIISDVTAYAEKLTNNSFSGTAQKTEYYSGDGSNTLILNRRPVVSLDAIEYTAFPTLIESDVSQYNLDNAKGIINRLWDNTVFPIGSKNIKVTYTYGYASLPADIINAVVYLSMAELLAADAGFSGSGGSLSIVAYSESYGGDGVKYGDARKRYSYRAMTLLNKYKTGIIGE